MRKQIRIALFFIFALTLSKVAVASQAGLAEALEKLMAGASEDIRWGLVVADAKTGQVLYARNAETPLNPASNTKVLSSLAALSALGPHYQFKTQFLGLESKKGKLRELTLKGFGDPQLRSADLDRMTAQLRERGIREIESLQVDDGFFDAGDFPGQMQGRQRDASFNRSVGALSLDHNLLEIFVSPGESVGAAAKVEIIPPLPNFPLDGEVLTQGKKSRIVVKSLPEDPEALGARISGRIALKSEPQRYRLSVHQPLQLAALRLRESLKSQGINLPEEIAFRPASPKSKVLVEHRSPPLSLILPEINKSSDNFVAEQLTKTLGAEAFGEPGSTAKGVQAILKELKALGLPIENIDIENGSGLSKENRFSAQTLAQALHLAYRDPKLRENFLSSLSVLGVDGTLRRKFRRSDLAGRFYGKTGTLNGVSSLSGYAFPKNPDSEPFIFAAILNGRGKNFWKEKQRAQEILETLLNW